MLKMIFLAGGAIALSACTSMHHGEERDHHAKTMAEHHGPHIISMQSNAEFDQTLTQLQSAISARGFKTFAVIDHTKGAASIGQELRPTTLVIFGNPKGGTPLMQAEQKIGLQLPLKALVAEDEAGAVHIIYPDMAHLFHEYGIGEMTGPLEKIEGALATIAAEAAQE